MNLQQLEELISLGEGHTTEFKKSLSGHIGREVSAFANSNGGILLVGVTDDGQIVGVKDHSRTKSEIQTITRSFDPPLIVWRWSTLEECLLT